MRTANSDLSSQLESSQNRLMELSIELGQLRDDVSRLRDQIQTKDQTNGKRQTPLRYRDRRPGRSLADLVSDRTVVCLSVLSLSVCPVCDVGVLGQPVGWRR